MWRRMAEIDQATNAMREEMQSAFRHLNLKRRIIEVGSLALAVVLAVVSEGLFKIGFLNALLAGFSVSVTLYTVLVTMVLESAPPARLRVLAARHDAPGVLVLIAGLMIDFAALGLIIRLLLSRHLGGAELILAAAAIAAAWVLLNMLFAIHYAHVFFAAGDKPPLDFPGEGDADRRFSDFIYFSFVTGMTFQVSDVCILENSMRRLVLAQSVLAFLFNVFVLALSVNAIGNLL